ncbi:MAG: TraR/DksA family transcriptional regulator [Nitrospinota bacterium]
MISKTHKQLMDKLLKRKEELLANEPAIGLEKLTETELARGDQLDIAGSASEHEMSMTMRLRATEELKMIDEAIKKLHNGTYGICDNCEENIESKRLKARPFVQYCLKCQEDMEREGEELKTAGARRPGKFI